jgi:hypothetical protein
MEISERIESCINELDARRQQMAAFESRVRALINALSVQGAATGPLGEALAVLEGALGKYVEIDVSCRQMIEGLREIGRHLDRIEDGRKKIVEGVERILGHLSQLDELANKGIVLGTTQGGEEEPDRPKRVLLIRVRPESSEAGKARWDTSSSEAQDVAEEEDLDLPEAGDSRVH